MVERNTLVDIPKDWEIKRLEEETEILTCGVAATPTYVNETIGVPFLSAQNVRNGKVVLDKYRYISKQLHEELTKSNKPQIGDILYSRVGAKFGEAGVVEHDFEFSVYVSLTHIRVRPTSDPYFVKFLLNSEYVKNKANRSVFQGAGVPNLNVKVVRGFKLAFPPLPEQQKIAEVLSAVDEKIEIVNQQILETQQLKKGMMQRLLSKGVDHTEFKDSKLGKIPKSWEVKKMKEICDVRDGTHDSPKYYDDGVPFITSKNLTDTGLSFDDVKYINKQDHLKFSKRSHVENGDILFGMIGTVGKPIIVNEKFDFSIKNVALLKFKSSKELNNVFALNILKSTVVLNQFRKMSNGGVLKFVSLGNIRNLLFPLPPLQEQQKIADILSVIDDKLELLVAKKEEFQQLKKGLMQQLLTGKIRVKV